MIEQTKEDFLQKVLHEAYRFYEKREFEKSLDCIKKIFKVDPDNAQAYLLKGNILSEFNLYKEAIEVYDKAINRYQKDDNKARAYFNKGNTLKNLNKYQEAVDAYEKAAKLYDNKSYKTKIYFNKGIALKNLNKYEEAVESYDNAIKLCENNNDKIKGYLLKGSAILLEKKNIKEAIAIFNEVIKLNPNEKNSNELIVLSYLKLKDWKKAGEFFSKTNIKTVEIISFLDEEEDKAHANDIVCSLLKYQAENFFWKVLDRTNVCQTTDRPCQQHSESCNECKILYECKMYRDIYLKSLQIIACLQVNLDFEEKVAHYTTKDSAHLLLLSKNDEIITKKEKKSSLFKLISTAETNDPKEGQTLFDYLFSNHHQQPSLGIIDSNFRAFIGCFTFNQQGLHQFRLHGREKGKEASCISIVVKDHYFNEEIVVTKNMRGNFVNIDKEIEVVTEKEDKKLSLFRCIYIDPDTEAVISLAHKELYAYIREEIDKNKEIKILKKNHDKYLKNIQTQLDKVTELLEQLKELVSNPDLNPQTVSELLLMLSHLVKHVAFKEEQECRILEIASLTDGDKTVKVESEIDNNYYRMFIDYLPMTDSVDRLYMGNQFEDFAMFKDLIKQQYQGKVKCYISTHPFAIT